MRKKGFTLFISTCLIVCMSSVSLASLKYVDSLKLDIAESKFFDHTSNQFVLETPIGDTVVAVEIGDIHVFGGGWDYTFEGTITISSNSMAYTNPSGLRAQAAFWDDSATVTVTATSMTDKTTGTEIVNETTNPGGLVLLTAVMDNPDTYWWLLETSDHSNDYNGNTHYQITGGDLHNGSLLRMFDSAASWAFPGCSPDPINNFNINQDVYCSTPVLEFIPDSVPEPATLLLLAAGGLLARKRK